ncbi:hypothetical protein F4808DRAFT_452624 [Astrocystis sublimbata]|nr:hypothetical protein F4808DRAFT_452624 [Astrocystis sublimbata]
MQQRTRTECKFAQTEADLPDWSGGAAAHIVKAEPTLKSRLTALLSYLGPRNPLARPVTADDTLWLLDNTAYRNSATGQWEAEFVAAMFSQHSSSPVVDVATTIAEKIKLEKRDPDYRTIEKRLGPFVQDIRPGTYVSALYGGKTPLELGPSGHNGISSDIKSLPGSGNEEDGKIVSTFAKVPSGANGLLEGRTFCAEPEGWGVISDIDDTIKITQTSDPIGILRTTFSEEPEAAPGMPELYEYIHKLIKPASAWFYLSASPYNLYPFLREFRQAHYPHGTIILRDASWMSVRGLLTTLTLGTEEYKVDRMEKVHGWLPKRKMICVGDSTQSDPEAYGEMYRRYPGWIKAILIRKVEDIAAIGIEAKNEPERFEKAFEDIPRDVWHVFSDPESCKKPGPLTIHKTSSNSKPHQPPINFNFARTSHTYSTSTSTSTSTMSAPESAPKRQKSNKDVAYELIYWPSIPGRGEFIRLALEEGGAEYTDTAHVEKGVDAVLAQISSENVGDLTNPPPLAPPILRHGDLLISQTPNILLYLAPRLGLAGEEEDKDAIYKINALVLTALDGLSNEVHDTHHPIASSLYYEDQKEEAKRRAGDFVKNRLPKFLGYFQRVLTGQASGDGPWLYGGRVSVADLVLFQVLDGVMFAFPKAISAAQTSGNYIDVFKLYDAVKERPKIKAYLDSERRQKYSQGIYRYYPELDLALEDVPQSDVNP